MPVVGGKHYPYTREGRAAAEAARRRAMAEDARKRARPKKKNASALARLIRSRSKGS